MKSQNFMNEKLGGQNTKNMSTKNSTVNITEGECDQYDDAKEIATDDAKEISKQYLYYNNIGNNRYLPVNRINIEYSLPSGLYSIEYNSSLGESVFVLESFATDKLYNLPILELNLIKKDISQFWKKEDKFIEYGLIHKRGILLYGKPGCGKSCAIDIVINDLIDNHKGLVFKISNDANLNIFLDFFSSRIKVIEPKRKVVVIIEDIDGLFETSKSTQTKLLNLLDGINQSNNIVYLATTNYPEKLEERILNRPSRFDKRYEFRMPTHEIRKAYFHQSFKNKDIENIDLDYWVESSEGLTLSHLRELIVSVIILGNDFEDEIKTLKDMKHLINSSSYKDDNPAGFKMKKQK